MTTLTTYRSWIAEEQTARQCWVLAAADGLPEAEQLYEAWLVAREKVICEIYGHRWEAHGSFGICDRCNMTRQSY